MAIPYYHFYVFHHSAKQFSLLWFTPLVPLLPSARVTPHHPKFYLCQLPSNVSSLQSIRLVSGISLSQCLPLLTPETKIIFLHLGKKGRKPKSTISEICYPCLFCSKCSFHLQFSKKQTAAPHYHQRPLLTLAQSHPSTPGSHS